MFIEYSAIPSGIPQKYLIILFKKILRDGLVCYDILIKHDIFRIFYEAIAAKN